MPVVQLQITPGSTRQQREAVIRRITEALVEEMGKHAEHIHIVINEVAEDHWGYSGMLTDDYRAGQAKSAAE